MGIFDSWKLRREAAEKAKEDRDIYEMVAQIKEAGLNQLLGNDPKWLYDNFKKSVKSAEGEIKKKEQEYLDKIREYKDAKRKVKNLQKDQSLLRKIPIAGNIVQMLQFLPTAVLQYIPKNIPGIGNVGIWASKIRLNAKQIKDAKKKMRKTRAEQDVLWKQIHDSYFTDNVSNAKEDLKIFKENLREIFDDNEDRIDCLSLYNKFKMIIKAKLAKKGVNVSLWENCIHMIRRNEPLPEGLSIKDFYDSMSNLVNGKEEDVEFFINTMQNKNKKTFVERVTNNTETEKNTGIEKEAGNEGKTKAGKQEDNLTK